MPLRSPFRGLLPCSTNKNLGGFCAADSHYRYCWRLLVDQIVVVDAVDPADSNPESKTSGIRPYFSAESLCLLQCEYCA